MAMRMVARGSAGEGTMYASSIAGEPPIRRRRSARLGYAAVLMGAALLLSTGCQNNEHRITLAELNELERQIADQPAVPVAHAKLALTDLRPYKVVPGDVLRVRLVGLDEDRYKPTFLDVRVHGDGGIALPVVGQLKVAGLDLAAVEEAITAAHVPDVVTDLAVFVQLSDQESTTVLVLGAAGGPGLVKLGENERNPLYALATAGGFGPAASGRVRLRPIRPQRQEVVYDLTNVNDVRRALLGPPLESGDVLMVEAAENSAVYITGLVNQPGPIPIPPGSNLSALRAVASAGGIRPYLNVKEAALVRSLSNGEQVQVQLDIGDMLAGGTPDLALRSGDILHIPHTPETLAQEWFWQNVMVGPFSVGVQYDPLRQYNTNRAIKADNNDGFSNAIRRSISGSLPNLLVPPVVAP